MIPQVLLAITLLLTCLFGPVKLISLGHSDSLFMKRAAIETTKILRQEKSHFCLVEKNYSIKVVCREPQKKIQLQFN